MDKAWIYQLSCSARLLDSLDPPLPPQLLGVDDRVNLTFFPPLLFFAYGVERPMVGRAKGHVRLLIQGKYR
jgi:hypothetical protein